MKKDYKLQKLKNSLNSLRMKISRKGFGTEIKSFGSEYFISIKTTESTGHFSKRTISGSLTINSAFLGLQVREQERKLLNTLEK